MAISKCEKKHLRIQFSPRLGGQHIWASLTGLVVKFTYHIASLSKNLMGDLIVVIRQSKLL